MSSYSALETSYNALLSAYDEHRSVVRALQHTLIEDILPDVLDDTRATNVSYDEEQVRQWAGDSEHIFRMLKRHKFTTSFTLQALRATLIWRLTSLSVYLSSMSQHRTSRIIRLLPRSCRDHFNRPIVIFDLAAFLSLLGTSSEDAKDFVLLMAENLRSYLSQLNEDRDHDDPILQCVMIVNVEDVSWTNSGPDLITWYLHDVQPHFPGMLAAVFIQGHSWVHSQMWSIIKRLLPASSQSKVFFFSRRELVDYFGSNVLPEDYGGTIQSSQTLDDLLYRHVLPSSTQNHITGSISDVMTPTPSRPSMRPNFVPATHSSINPFFGYPVTHSMRPRHGRRRKRDLMLTLALLWWTKWKRTILWWAVVGVVLWLAKRTLYWSALRGKIRLTASKRGRVNAIRERPLSVKGWADRMQRIQDIVKI